MEHPFPTSLTLDKKSYAQSEIRYVANELLSKQFEIKTSMREIKASQLCDGRELSLSLFNAITNDTMDSNDVFPQLGLLLITDLEQCEKDLGRKLSQFDLNKFYQLCKRNQSQQINTILDNWVIILQGKPFSKCFTADKNCLEPIIVTCAESGDADIQYVVGEWYYDKSCEQSHKHYELRDLQKFAHGMANMYGMSYSRNKHIQKLDKQIKKIELEINKSKEEAAKWFKKAAEQGHKEAADELEYLINQYGIKI